MPEALQGTLLPAVVVSLVGLCTGAVIDYRTGRLPNWLTFSMMALGLVMWISVSQPLVGVFGLLAATAIHFTLFALGVVRAGDAKLVMGAGALMGWQYTVEITLWYAVIYIPVGLGMLIYKRRLGNLVKAARRELKAAKPGEESPDLTYLRTGPIIAAAGVIATFTDWLNFA